MGNKKKKTAAKKSSARREPVADVQKTWDEAMLGSSPADFTAYALSGVFKVGDLLRHKKFGDGVVVEVQEGLKMQVLFAPGSKTLAYGR